MAKAKEYNYTFNIPQEELEEEIEFYAPLSKKQEQFINDETNQILAWGGGAASGKSTVSLLKLMIDCIEHKRYSSYLLRESLVQIKSPGSLWEEGSQMFESVGVTTNQIENRWRFPNGSLIKCHYLKGNQKDFQGSQLHSACIDEAAQIPNFEDIMYVTSRLRGKGDKIKQLRMTFNPDRNSPLCQLIIKAGYIDKDGFPDPSQDGKTKYMIQLQGDYEFFETKKEIEELYGKDAAKAAYKFVYYSATALDNPAIIKDQPEYLFKLKQLKPVERDRLLYGNFFADANNSGAYVKREDFKEIAFSDVPLNLPIVRSWDLAGTKPNPEKGGRYADPDWTRGTLCAYDKNTQNFYIMDMKSLRDRSALVNDLIMRTARDDKRDYDAYTIIPQDAGSAGKEVAETKRSNLLSIGAKPIIYTQRKSKLKLAENFLIALQEGRVFVVRGVFSEGNYTELENFSPGDKNFGSHDDIMDTLSQAYNILTSGRLIPSIKVSRDNPRLNSLIGKTILSS